MSIVDLRSDFRFSLLGILEQRVIVRIFFIRSGTRKISIDINDNSRFFNHEY